MIAAVEKDEEAEFITLSELARRLGVARATLYKYTAELGEEDGVIRFNPRVVRVDWAKFREAARAGRIKFASAIDGGHSNG